MKNDIGMAAAITLYRPDVGMVENILNIKSYFERIYLFDNTESDLQSDKIREKLRVEGVKYATRKSNMGLACALNVCCNAAYQDGFQWIMLLDQDSIITDELLVGMKKFIQEYDEEKLAIAVPMIEDNNTRNIRTERAKRKKAVITSGMILKLEAFKKNGYFKTALFLDGVDFEFCLRLYKNGYFILQNNQVVLKHNQYDRESIIDQYKINKYSALRYYYMFRSYYYIKEHYSEEKAFVGWLREINQRLIQEMLIYDNCKVKKVIAVILGIIDYKLGRFGKCRWKILM